MRCLDNESSENQTLSTFLPYIRMFVSQADYIRTITGFLERLGSLAFKVTDISKEFGLNAREVFELILSCDEVRESLRPLVPYIEYIREQILSDPRHKTLRPYLEILLETLMKIPPSEKILMYTRESLQQIEQYEQERFESESPIAIPIREPETYLESDREAEFVARNKPSKDSLWEEFSKRRSRKRILLRNSPLNYVVCFYLIPLIIVYINYFLFLWITVNRTIKYFQFSVGLEFKNQTFTLSGWDLAWVLHDFYSAMGAFGVNTLFHQLIAWSYMLGLILITIGFFAHSSLLSFFGGLAMCIHVYELQSRMLEHLNLYYKFVQFVLLAEVTYLSIDATIHVIFGLIVGVYFLIVGTAIMFLCD